MNSLRPKNDLRYISDISNLVALIVLRVKEEFKHIEIDKVKANHELIVFIMELIDVGVILDEVISKKLVKKLDKNQLVLDIFEAMFPELTDDEKKSIEGAIQFILNNKVLRSNNFFCEF
jgi:hypothetical protein